MAAELELPEHMFVHGFLLMDGEKMSKSLGNVLDPFAVIERFGADALRFYLLRDVPFGQDGSVSTAAFEQRYESELANELGNLASRTLAMIERYRDGVARRPGALDPVLARGLRRPLRARRGAARPRRADARARRDLAARAAAEPLRRGAGAVAARQGRVARGATRPSCCARSPRACAVVTVLLWPYLPASAERLLAALGAPDLSLAGARARRRRDRAGRASWSRCSRRTAASASSSPATGTAA